MNPAPRLQDTVNLEDEVPYSYYGHPVPKEYLDMVRELMKRDIITEMRATIQAARQKFPDKKLVVVFHIKSSNQYCLLFLLILNFFVY